MIVFMPLLTGEKKEVLKDQPFLALINITNYSQNFNFLVEKALHCLLFDYLKPKVMDERTRASFSKCVSDVAFTFGTAR